MEIKHSQDVQNLLKKFENIKSYIYILLFLLNKELHPYLSNFYFAAQIVTELPFVVTETTPEFMSVRIWLVVILLY